MYDPSKVELKTKTWHETDEGDQDTYHLSEVVYDKKVLCDYRSIKTGSYCGTHGCDHKAEFNDDKTELIITKYRITGMYVNTPFENNVERIDLVQKFLLKK